jgi:methoxymalonate biosynthesis acyl carrier protein
MATSDVKNRIEEFIARFFQHVDLQDNQDIFALGFVNSLFAMQLVLFVEKEFGITIEDGELDIENFRTINAIAKLIEHKSTPQASA